jgi:hypothetical protein
MSNALSLFRWYGGELIENRVKYSRCLSAEHPETPFFGAGQARGGHVYLSPAHGYAPRA